MISRARFVVFALWIPSVMAACSGSDDSGGATPQGGSGGAAAGAGGSTAGGSGAPAGAAGMAAGGLAGMGGAGSSTGGGGQAGAGQAGAGQAGAGQAGAGQAGAGQAGAGQGGAGTAGAGGDAGGSAGSTGCVDPDALPLEDVPPAKLSQTGLYADIATLQTHQRVMYFQPKYVLWSDGAEKKRWVYIPKCAKINTNDMDHWSFPVGTRLYKEFGSNGKRYETRMIHRYGPGPDDFMYVSYMWRADQTEADLASPGGVQNVLGSNHDIPSHAQCVNCHGKLSEHVLGFGAIQLSHDLSGETIKSLSAAGRLTVPAPEGFLIPGDDKPVGYLHANCGNCHNDSGVTVAMRLRVLTTAKTVPELGVYKTAVGKAPDAFMAPGVTSLVEPGVSDASAIIYRMSRRNDVMLPTVQMPPIGTEVVHQAGVKLIREWIDAMPKGSGGSGGSAGSSGSGGAGTGGAGAGGASGKSGSGGN